VEQFSHFFTLKFRKVLQNISPANPLPHYLVRSKSSTTQDYILISNNNMAQHTLTHASLINESSAA